MGALGEGEGAHGCGEIGVLDVDRLVRLVDVGAPRHDEGEEAAGLEEFGVDAVEEGVYSVSEKRDGFSIYTYLGVLEVAEQKRGRVSKYKYSKYKYLLRARATIMAVL